MGLLFLSGRDSSALLFPRHCMTILRSRKRVIDDAMQSTEAFTALSDKARGSLPEFGQPFETISLRRQKEGYDVLIV